jgi:glutathione-regulated potassium-efflux system ancillary protein KefC
MNALATAAALLAAAVILVPLFKKIGLGSVLGYLVAGVLIGPSAFGVVTHPETILSTAEFGIALLMFLIGLELQRDRLWALRHSVFGLGPMQIIGCGGAMAAIAFAFGFSLSASIIIGIALSMTSTAFMMPALAERGELDQQYGREAFAVSLFQDLSVIPIIAVVALLGAKSEGTQPGWLAVVTIIAVLALGKPLLSLMFRYVSRFGSRDVFTAAALLTTIGLAWLMTSVGLSTTLGAFLAGVLLAESQFRHELEASIEPFESLLLGLFFMAVGMGVNLGLLASQPLLVVGIAVGVLIVKAVVFYALRRGITRAPDSLARPQAIALAVGGEFAFVLFAAALNAQFISKSQSDVLTLAVVLTMILAPLLWIVNDKLLVPWLAKEEPAPFDLIDDPATPVIIAGYGRVGQIVGRILNMRDVKFTALDAASDHVDSVRRFGNKIYYGDASSLALLHAAKTKDAKYFVVCVDDVAASLKIVELVRKTFPQVIVLSRARNRTHAMQLREMGVENPMRETFWSSIELTKDLLLRFGESLDQIQRTVDTFVKHDADLLDRQQAIFRDEDKLVAMSKEARAQLDDILSADAAAEGKSDEQAPEDRLSTPSTNAT